MKLRKLSVTEVNEYAKKLLSYDPILQHIKIEGEISNFVAHSSGHAYFSLKDDESKINCVMFKQYFSLIDFKIKNGDKVDCEGNVSIYQRDGKFQLYVKSLEKAGKGALHIKFEKLKEKYKELGYFDDKHKKEIPKYPKKIGIITSSKGAALKDIISVFNRRTSLAKGLVYSVNVQGIYSKEEIVKAIDYFNNDLLVDLIIISRGGGSIEELWSFNEGIVVESIFDSSIPIITGVGHETDYTLVDFVSDLRAPTPSAAAEMAFISNEEIMKVLEYYHLRLNQLIQKKLHKESSKLQQLSLKNYLKNKKISLKYTDEKANQLYKKLNEKMNNKIKNYSDSLKDLILKLNYNNPINNLKRGYSIIEKSNNKIISSINSVEENEIVEIYLKDGKLKAKIIKKSEECYE